MRAKQLRIKKPSVLNKVLKRVSCSILMMFFSLLVYALFALLFTGCAGKEYVEIVKTVEVKTPVECNLSAPVIAPYEGGEITQEKRLKNEINIYVYTEDLEETLKACKGEK